ncbi:hypothetical protein PRIPAC_75905 [Pristionchus pacificus]|uniref:Uncharacterized protein n=1 Tax=Pristionchus pacificus TaxID=54126 RepID=A0A2A6CAC7_PRIPA|nr:hypothetical protein PRIPAC_75905 [Pristionchus pacificus]|eukprot:PDM75175.1 hypothetical protein PRIPAC_40556 [Pristionchus pacificus]
MPTGLSLFCSAVKAFFASQSTLVEIDPSSRRMRRFPRTGTCVTAVFGSKREAALAVSAASPFIAQSINKDGAQFRAVIEMPTFAAANNLVHRTDLKMRFYYFIAGEISLPKDVTMLIWFGMPYGTFYKITFEEQTSSDHFGLWINDFPLMGTRLYCEPRLVLFCSLNVDTVPLHT